MAGMGASKSKAKGRKIGRNLEKCKRYMAADKRKRNKTREAAKMKRHLLKAAARRARNHPEKASERDFLALAKLAS